MRIERIARLYEKGQTLAEIGAGFGVHGRTVSRWLKEAGFTVRSASEKMSGPLNPSWQGGVVVKKGYRKIWVNGGYVWEHRWKMEKKLGRKLTKNEVVHHRNGNPLDNRLSNLKLCRSPAEHRAEHVMTSWSRKFSACRRCHRTDRKHSGDGLCTACYMYVRTAKARGYTVRYDSTGKRIFTQTHRERLSAAAKKRKYPKKG